MRGSAPRPAHDESILWLSPDARDKPPSDPRGVIRIARQLCLKDSILRDNAIEQERHGGSKGVNRPGPWRLSITFRHFSMSFLTNVSSSRVFAACAKSPDLSACLRHSFGSPTIGAQPSARPAD